MPIESCYTDVVRTRMNGVITFDELVEHLRFLCSLELDTSLWIEFTDQSEATSMEISSCQATVLSEMAKPIHETYFSIHNIILTSNPSVFGSNRMVGTHMCLESEKPNWHFAASREDAEQLISKLLAGQS